MPRLWYHRITDILEAIHKIHAYLETLDFQAFQQDTKTIDAVIRNFIVIGEAARHIPLHITDQYPLIPWRLMGDMRNFAVHEYWGVELQTIWMTIQDDLPSLVPLLSRLLAEQRDTP